MAQNLVSLTLDQKSFSTYITESLTLTNSRGGLLREALEKWVIAGCPRDLMKKPNRRSHAASSYIVTAAVPLRVYEAITCTQLVTGHNRSTVMRGALRWYHTEYGKRVPSAPGWASWAQNISDDEAEALMRQMMEDDGR